jgi:ribonucleoside-diphosphate reductase alpha chain
MDITIDTQEILSDVVIYNKYAKYLPLLKRRETWNELVDRYISMLITKYGTEHDKKFLEVNGVKPSAVFSPLARQIIDNSSYIYDKEVLPSMRALQFAGAAIVKNEARGYNCSYMPIEDYTAFSELMFLLLGGTGAGYSVQFRHVAKLPAIKQPVKTAKFLIGDSIEGWADAVKQLMKAYMGKTKVAPRFDYSDIREKGARLVTAGGKAPGPEPLRIALTKIEGILREKKEGDKLTPFESNRICCLIADAVLAGGIRRAALIALFSMDDLEMATAKHGQWWELYPELGRANNSAVIVRERVKKEDFETLWQMVVDSNSGEPGVYFTNDPEYGTNPCCEISLRPYTFCNLTEINAGSLLDGWVESDEGLTNRGWRQGALEERAQIAAFYGTLQAGITDFHYLRSIWKTNTEKDALIGVGITGVGNGLIEDLDLEVCAELVMIVNEDMAEEIGINVAARSTTIKPAGTTSCVVRTASGCHAWHGPKYIRNIQCRVGDDLYNFFTKYHPELIEVMKYDPMSAVIGIPQIAPEGAILRENETALQLLERVKRLNLEWVHKGHKRGPNTNNVSATISVKDEEWDSVGEWMWENRHTFNGLSVLPFDGGSYANAPFEVVSDEVFERKLKYILENEIDLTLIVEEEDNTVVSDTIACAGNACEI